MPLPYLVFEHSKCNALNANYLFRAFRTILALFSATIAEYHRLGNLSKDTFVSVVLEIGESRLTAPASGGGFLATPSDGRSFEMVENRSNSSVP